MTKISINVQVDSDGSGSIEFLEFLLLMGRILKDVPTDADLRDVFTGKLQLVKTRGWQCRVKGVHLVLCRDRPVAITEHKNLRTSSKVKLFPQTEFFPVKL